MSEPEEDLELQALQRQLDDAFETTRPRRGFEDELWVRMQASRPATNRLRDALAGLIQGIREVPAVPAAAVAAALVVALGVGLLANSGLGRHAGGASTAGGIPSQLRGGDQAAGGFGVLPSPVFDQGSKLSQVPAQNSPNGAEYAGPVQVVWAGQSSGAVADAPVYRYQEPSTNVADQFASSLGAVLRERPQGFLGAYSASDYTLKVRGTVQSPAVGPTYFIVASAAMPAIDATGASQADLASIFLAQHSLVPDWSYTVSVDKSGDPVRVRYERQFGVPGYGLAYLVDTNGARYGLEVDLSGNRPVLASGLLPVSLDTAYYRIVSPDEAIRPALASPNVTTTTPPPTIQLTKVELVYLLVPAGGHSFYEPAYLYSGKLQVKGVTYTKHVLEPAVDRSQRAP